MGLCGEKGCQDGEITIHGTGQRLVVTVKANATLADSNSFYERIPPNVRTGVATIISVGLLLAVTKAIKSYAKKGTERSSTAQRNKACQTQTTDPAEGAKNKKEDIIEGKDVDVKPGDGDDSSLSMDSLSTKSASLEPENKTSSQIPPPIPIDGATSEESSDPPSLVSEITPQGREMVPVCYDLSGPSNASIAEQVYEIAIAIQKSSQCTLETALQCATSRANILEQERFAREREARGYVFQAQLNQQDREQSERQHSESIRSQNQDKNWREKTNAATAKCHDSIKKGLVWGLGCLLGVMFVYDLCYSSWGFSNFLQDPFQWMLSKASSYLEEYGVFQSSGQSVQDHWLVQNIMGGMGFSDPNSWVSTIASFLSVQVVNFVVVPVFFTLGWQCGQTALYLVPLYWLVSRFSMACLLAIFVANIAVFGFANVWIRQRSDQCESQLSSTGKENPQSIDVNNQVQRLYEAENIIFMICMASSSVVWVCCVFLCTVSSQKDELY